MKNNILDRVIEFVSPSLALNRQASRLASEELRKYDAASRGRRTAGWEANSTSANTEMLLSLQLLRDRSREMVRNNPYAKNAIDVITTNTVGTGIRANITGNTPKQQQRWRDLWTDWAETTECDFEGVLNFYGLQELALRCIIESGSVLIIKKNVGSKAYKTVPLKLQVVEPDLIDINSRDNPILPNGGYIQQGIEFDKNGVRVAYWLFPRHPGEQFSHTMISSRVLASEIIHVYKKDRPGQVNGTPHGVSTLTKLKDLDDYFDAELMRQKIAACFVAFIRDTEANAINGKRTKDTTAERVEPGIIERLPYGKEVTFGTPPTTTGQEAFRKINLQSVAVGYGVSYESLTGDLSNVNFTSGRMGWLEMGRKVVNLRINVMIPGMCDKVFSWFSDAAEILGIDSKGLKTTWTSPRREMIDPVKETKGISIAIRNGLTSWSEAVREQGRDPDVVMKQLIEDKNNFDDAGLVLECDASNDMPPTITESTTG